MSCVVETRPASKWIDHAIAAPFLTLVRWYRISQERAALREMPAERLDDLGLSRKQARCEALRPFWDASSGR